MVTKGYQKGVYEWVTKGISKGLCSSHVSYAVPDRGFALDAAPQGLKPVLPGASEWYG
jgi:hypothetical protein